MLTRRHPSSPTASLAWLAILLAASATPSQVQTGPNDVRLSTIGVDGDSGNDAHFGAIAYNSAGDEYLVVYDSGPFLATPTEPCHVLAQRVDAATGSPVGTPTVVGDIELSSAASICLSSFPRVVYNADDDEYLVVWRDEADAPSTDVILKARRLDAATGMPVTGELPVNDGGVPLTPQRYDVTWNGVRNEYLVVWDVPSVLAGPFYETRGQRLDAAGQRIGVTAFQINSPGAFFSGEGVAVVHNSGRDEYLVLWNVLPDGPSPDHVLGQRLDGAGAEIGSDDFVVSAAAVDDRGILDVVYNAQRDEYLAVVLDRSSATGGPHGVLGLRLDGASGAGLGGGPFTVGSAVGFGYEAAAAAHDTTHDTYLVTWIGESGTAGTREQEAFVRTVSATGSILGPSLPVSDMGPDGDAAYDAAFVAVAYSPIQDEHFVMWEGDDDSGQLIDEEFEIWGQRVGEAECYLVIGPGGGVDTFYPGVHSWQTQVGAVEDFHPVLLDDIPEFVLPTSWVVDRVHPPSTNGLGFAGIGVGKPPTAPPELAPWMQDGRFVVQVVMWNPQVFPALPEQFTAALSVTVLPDGTVRTASYGSSVGGMGISYELDTNAAGDPVIRFPFTIPGFRP